jgi:predicted aspartyl protease
MIRDNIRRVNPWIGILRSIALSTAAIVVVGAATPQACADDPQRSVFPLSPYDEPITIPVMIGNKERLFVLDSGSSVHVYDESLKELLEIAQGRHKVRSFFGNVFGTDEFRALPSRIGNEELSTDDSVTCLDLSSIRAATGRDIEGILGMPWLRAHVIQLDFDRGEMVVLPGATKPSADWGRGIAVRAGTSGLPELEVEVGDGIREECVLDTGFTSSISLRSSVFRTLANSKMISSEGETAVATVSGNVSSREGMLTILKISNFSHADVPVVDGGSRSRIGLKYMRRYRVTFDLGNGKVYLVPSAEYHRKDHGVKVGIGVVRSGEKTIVMQVLRESPGEKAGVLANDELLAINSERVWNKPVGEIRSILQAKLVADGGLTLTVRRDTQELSIPVRR